MRIKSCAEKYGYYFILIILAIASFVLFRLVGRMAGITGTLTVDDLCSVQFSMMGDGFFSKMQGIIANDPTNVPIFYFMLYGWIQLFGFSANTMRILPEIAAALFVIVIGLIGKEIKNKRMGIIAAIVAATSMQLIYTGYQVRAYSWLLLFSAITFLFWIKREDSKKSRIAFAVAMLLASYTHFLGVMVCAAFGALDLFSIILKKENKKCLWSYVIYGICFVPYLVIAYMSAMELWETFWPPVPGIRDYFDFLGRICPIGNIGVALFGIVFCVCLIMILKKRKIQQEIFACYWVVFAVLTVAFIYSRYINPTSSIWVYRYFLVLYPFTVTVVTYALEILIEWVEKHDNISRAVIVGILVFVGCVYSYRNIVYAKEHPKEVIVNGIDFESLTNEILNKEDVLSKDTLVYMAYPTIYFDGWKIYASENGKNDLPNLFCDEEHFTDKEIEQYETLYIVRVTTELPDDAREHVENTHEITDTVGDGVYFIDRYVKK